MGAQAHLPEFLFGQDRKALNFARPVLRELQQNRCFYCGKELGEHTEVDHFIPFAKYAFDLGHNFVLADRSCNNSKRDFLASYPHLYHWQEHNLDRHRITLTQELGPYVECNADKALAVADWAYQIARNNDASLWVNKQEFMRA